MSLIARFRIDAFEPRQVSDLDVDWFGVLTFAKVFTEGIVGEATTVFLSSGEDGSRSYVAVERITGHTDDGAQGSMTVHHGGVESDPEAGFGHIVAGSGSGGFAGWQGSAMIEHDDDGPYFVFDLA